MLAQPMPINRAETVEVTEADYGAVLARYRHERRPRPHYTEVLFEAHQEATRRAQKQKEVQPCNT